jgi:hypothetical protein
MVTCRDLTPRRERDMVTQHEDQELDQLEGLRRAADTLLEAAGPRTGSERRAGVNGG